MATTTLAVMFGSKGALLPRHRTHFRNEHLDPWPESLPASFKGMQGSETLTPDPDSGQISRLDLEYVVTEAQLADLGHNQWCQKEVCKWNEVRTGYDIRITPLYNVLRHAEHLVTGKLMTARMDFQPHCLTHNSQCVEPVVLP